MSSPGGLPKDVSALSQARLDAAQRGFAAVMQHVCRLYCQGESSSVSEGEAHRLAHSVLHVLGQRASTDEELLVLLSQPEVVETWNACRKSLEGRLEHTMALLAEAIQTMPQLNSIALRDTLTSIGRLRSSYDSFFGAHEVPASIDYPLARPVDEDLQGLDYLDAWLGQLLSEARFLACFDLEETRAVLMGWCPDYRGLLVNLCEPVFAAWRQGTITPKAQVPKGW